MSDNDRRDKNWFDGAYETPLSPVEYMIGLVVIATMAGGLYLLYWLAMR